MIAEEDLFMIDSAPGEDHPIPDRIEGKETRSGFLLAARCLLSVHVSGAFSV